MIGHIQLTIEIKQAIGINPRVEWLYENIKYLQL
jgi:hypothetical protein